MEINLHANHKPRVLLLGNGILRLAGGIDWNTLLNPLNTRCVPTGVLEQVPMSMRPETMSGTNVENISKQISAALINSKNCLSPQLEELLSLDFDCILTTNYTYEIEAVLHQGKWSKYTRSKCFQYLGDGNAKQHNLQCCYVLQRSDGKTIPVFHIHGDAYRSTSLVLSYHSYVRAAYYLFEYSKKRKNIYQENQQEEKPINAASWFDWFLCGDVYSVGFGWEPCEFDLWWANERKSREKAGVGKHIAYFTDENKEIAQKEMLRAMNAAVCLIKKEGREYSDVYNEIIADIRKRMEE